MGLYLRYSTEQGGSAFGECDLAFANVVLPPKILTQQGSTNLLTHSTDLVFSEWSKGDINIIANSAYMPDGMTYAHRLESSATGTNYLFQDFTPAVSGNYTFSMYVKAGEISQLTLYNLNVLAVFDLTAGIGNISTGFGTIGIEEAGSDWYRISSTVYAEISEPVIYQQGITFNSTVGQGLYFYGPQLEPSNVMSEYIPTYSTSVTRPDKYFQPTGIKQPGTDIESAVLASLLTWRRVSPEEVEPNGSRYGWWGDNLTSRPIGSKLWLLQRQKLLPNLKSKAKQYAEEALQWMVDDGVCSNVIVTPTITNEILSLNIQLIQNDGTITRINYDDLWNELKK